MNGRFKVGDHVSWNSEAGRVTGAIVHVITSEIELKGYITHASADEPQYEIKSAKTGHIAMHKGSDLRKLFALVCVELPRIQALSRVARGRGRLVLFLAPLWSKAERT